MAKKMRRVRTFARTASKSMEKRLVDNAKEIRETPHIVIPDYDDRYSAKCFDKIKKNLDKIHRFKDDAKKLEKLSNKHGLEGALAGTLIIAHSEKAPYLAVAKFPTGDITYAQRGRADKEKLIAVQHFDDPVYRILGIKDIATKRRLHVYSWDEGFVSTGMEAKPPEEFIDFIVKKTGFSKKNNVLLCGDLKADFVINKKVEKHNYLRIHWVSADIYFGICQNCAGKNNTVFNITKYLIEPGINDDFNVEFIGQIVKGSNSSVDVLSENVSDYFTGELSDRDFILKNIKKKEQSLRDSDEKMFILDGVSFGDDSDKFIEKLKPKKHEKEGLKLILNMVDEPVVFDDATPNKVLEKYWDGHGKNVINTIISDEEMSDKFSSLDDNPSDILESVFKYKERRKVLSMLPKYKSLPPLTTFIDNVARTYKTLGKKEALTEVKKRPDNPKGKSVAYAFLLVFGKAKDKKWQYSQVESEYGEFLKEYAKKLLDSKPEEYHNCLKELVTNSGSSEDVDSYLKK